MTPRDAIRGSPRPPVAGGEVPVMAGAGEGRGGEGGDAAAFSGFTPTRVLAF